MCGLRIRDHLQDCHFGQKECMQMTSNVNRESIPATFGFNDDYEREQFEYFQAVLQGKTRFLDIGANREIVEFMRTSPIRS